MDTTERTLDLQQFYDKVRRFDWYHEMSDSHQVFLAGEAAWSIGGRGGSRPRKDRHLAQLSQASLQRQGVRN